METSSVDEDVLVDPPHVPDPLSSTSQRPSRRDKVVLNWVKDTKIKTAKCKVCGQRAKDFSHRCEDCKIRICSECSSPTGTSPLEHKRVATDYLNEGCWCGFSKPKGFNTAFSDLYPLPPILADDKAVADSETLSNKRKRVPTQAADAGEKSPKMPQEISMASGSVEEQVPCDTSSARAAGPTRLSPGTRPVLKKQRVAQDAAPEVPSSFATASAIEESSEFATQDASSSGTCRPGAVDPQHLPVMLNVEEAEQSQPFADDVVPIAQDGRGVTSDPHLVTKNSTSHALAQTIPEAPEVSDSRRKVEKRPHDGQEGIVILGAGVIGLFIALELAQNAHVAGAKQHITVIDINSGPGLLASGQSTGLLTIHGMPDSWLSLVEAAADAWKELTASESFCEAVEFTEDVVTVGDYGKKHAGLHWLHEHLNFACDKDSLGLLDAMKLNQWLHSQCESFGVHFWFDTHATRIERDRAGEAIGVRVQSVDGGGAKSELIRCTDLVLATGPFTPHLLSKLCPDVRIQMNDQIHVNQWAKLSGFDLEGQSRLGLIVPDLAVHKDEFHYGALATITVPRDNAISVSCCRRLTRSLDLKPRDALESRRRSTVTLCELAARYFHAPSMDVASDGSSYISIGDGNKPIIGHAPVSYAHRGCSVWLCYGFGNHGTTLGPGVGRIVAAMVHGRIIRADISLFAAAKGQPLMPTGIRDERLYGSA